MDSQMTDQDDARMCECSVDSGGGCRLVLHWFTSLCTMDSQMTDQDDVWGEGGDGGGDGGLNPNVWLRLNVLVLLSQAVFTRLQQAVPRLRRVFLVAVYRVLSLALCNGQRAVRCAGIRCLRHYVRSNSDVDLLLSNRLDLFITRCFDLSYESGLSAAESLECKGRNVAAANTSLPQPAQQAALHARLPTLFGNRLMRPEFRRRIQPRSRLRSTSEDRTDVTRCAPSTTTKTSLQNRVGTAYTGIISPSSERLHVLKLAYQLLRLAPPIFPLSLVQALVSSCLSPLWVATAGSTVDGIMSTDNTLEAANLNEWVGAPAHPPLAGAHPPLPVVTTASNYEEFSDDPHIRACLLILVEFGKFAFTSTLFNIFFTVE
ncbi:hypothetical protein SprV_0501876700 [Sparganum proliferum]